MISDIIKPLVGYSSNTARDPPYEAQIEENIKVILFLAKNAKIALKSIYFIGPIC